MTMKLMKHGTRRAGFSDWPSYDNKPGAEEPVIAKHAYPDPLWVQEPPPKTYNTGQTVTGHRVAEKIRDLRLRRSLTGKTTTPRLRCKTNPKQLQAEQEVDFEEEVAKYKRDIDKDIQTLKKIYREPQWIKDILDTEKISDNQPEQAPGSRPTRSSSSSSWEQPIPDTQALEISDYIMTRDEERAFFSEGEELSQAWEVTYSTHEQHTIPEESPGDYWETWLEEINQLPMLGYQPFDDLLRSPYYMNQT